MHEIRYAILILFVFYLHVGLFALIQAGYQCKITTCYKAASLIVALAVWNGYTVR